MRQEGELPFSSLLGNSVNKGRASPLIRDLTLFNSTTINSLLNPYWPLTQQVYTAISSEVPHRSRGHCKKEGLYG